MAMSAPYPFALPALGAGEEGTKFAVFGKITTTFVQLQRWNQSGEGYPEVEIFISAFYVCIRWV